MNFVGSFHSGATAVLTGALMSRRAPRQHVHTVRHAVADTRNVDALVAALRRESDRSAALQRQVDALQMQLAVAAELLELAQAD